MLYHKLAANPTMPAPATGIAHKIRRTAIVLNGEGNGATSPISQPINRVAFISGVIKMFWSSHVAIPVSPNAEKMKTPSIIRVVFSDLFILTPHAN